MFTINETLAILEKDKVEIEEQIELVKRFDKISTADFTEEVYHKFCNTTLRGGDILGEKLASVFPFLTYQYGKNNYNEYVFDFKDIKSNKYFDIYVTIPNSAISAIEIKICKKKSFFIDKYDIEDIEKQIEKLEKVLTYSFSQRVEWCGVHFRKWFRPIYYIFKHNKKEINNKVTIAIEEQKERLKRVKTKQLKNKIMTEIYERITNNIINKYVPQFLEWSNLVILEGAYGKQHYTK